MPETYFVLGPSLEVTEPFPSEPALAAPPGHRMVRFRDPATTPGGNVHVELEPAASPDDKIPVNIYAFFVQPVSSVPPIESRTPDWFFQSGAPNASNHIGAATESGAIDIAVPGVKPSLQPYLVQLIAEYQK